MDIQVENNSKKSGNKKWTYYVMIGTILIIIYKFFDNFAGIGKWIGKLFSVLSPFFIAILMVFVLYTPCVSLEKQFKKIGHKSSEKKNKRARIWSIFIVYVLVGILLFLILRFVIPAAVQSIMDLVNNAQSYYNGITTNALEASWAPFVKEKLVKPLVDYIQKIDFQTLFTPDKIKEYMSSAVGIGKAFINFFIAIICSVRMLYSRESIVRGLNRFAKATLTDNGYRRFNKYFTSGCRIFFKYISSQFLDGFVVAIMMSVAFVIMKIKYGILLGVLIGLCNLIPYFGAIFGVAISALITVLTGGWQQALIMLVVMIVISQIDANIINPRITGSSLNVNPLLIVFCVTIGGAYFGIAGMFIGVPVGVLIKLMIDDFVEHRLEKKQKENQIEKQSEEEK